MPAMPSHGEDDPQGLLFMHRLLGVLRSARIAREWSVSELSKESGVHHSIIHRAENGERFPSIPVTFRIARAMGIPLSRLVKIAESADESAGSTEDNEDRLRDSSR